MKRLFKITFTLLAVIIVGGIAVYFVYFNQPEESVRNEPPAKEWQEMTLDEQKRFSRVTFFHSGPYMASLAIPAEWEGKYRMETEKKRVNFVYLGKQDKGIPIFFIDYCQESECTQANNAQRVARKGDVVFRAGFSGDKRVDQQYNHMTSEAQNILSSFKAFPIN